MANINFADPTGLTTPTKDLTRVKYFPIEVKAVGLKTNTNYTALYNGANVNAFCKLYGGDLGQQLKSDQTGQILFLFLLAIPFNQTFLVNNNGQNTPGIVLSSSSATIQLQDPTGNLTTTYLPLNLKM